MDYKQVVYWYGETADQGNAYGQSNLGEMYRDGKGVTRDYKQAVYWFEKAADQGSSYGQYYLGKMYDEGKGVVKDDVQAAYWSGKAADWLGATKSVKTPKKH